MRIYKNLPKKIQRRFISLRSIYTVESRVNKRILYALSPEEIAIAYRDVAVRCDISIALQELKEAKLRPEILKELEEVITEYKEIVQGGYILGEKENDQRSN